MHSFTRVVIAVAALVGVATLAAAQTPSRIVNRLEVQKLVAAETTVANHRLAIHFDAVADRYVTEARRHKAMGVVFSANAQRSVATMADDYWERQAALATKWAVAARELARYHVGLAVGKAPVVPHHAAELQAGRGAPEPTVDQLHKLALLARTRTDHLVLQEYYAMVARKKLTEADNHERLATGYRVGVHKGSYDAAVTCERHAQLARQAAKKATEAANRHRQLATIA